MNKNLMILIGLIVAGVIGAYLFLNKPAQNGELTGNNNAQTMSASLAQLLAAGQDYSCTFETTDDAGLKTDGTIYVADQGHKMSGKFMTTNADNTQTQTSMMSDGQYTYIWSADQTQGFKMKVDPENDTLLPEGDDSSEVGFDADQQLDFNCQPWRPDNSLFVPPTGIEFVDFSAQVEMMQEQSETMQQDSGANCAICDQVPAGDARTQCLTSLGC
jgi:hypothetical protein